MSRSVRSRNFGFVFATFLLIVGVGPTLLHHGPLRIWALVLAAVFAAAAILLPSMLIPLEVVWRNLGLLLHRLTSPVLTALIFWLAFVPMAVVLRLMRKQLLPVSRDADATSYWIVRTEAGIPAQSMLRQY